MRTLPTFAALLAAGLLTASAATAQPLRVVELFQSRDCANCPAAQTNLDALAGHDDVLALSYPVSFRAPADWAAAAVRGEFIDRHTAYAAATGVGEVATPQMVLNGRLALRGKDASEVAVVLRDATPIESQPRLRLVGRRLLVAGPARPPRPLDIWLVRFNRAPQPRFGHGKDDTASYRNIVESIERVGLWRGAEMALALPRAGETGSAVLLQERDAGPILAVIEVDASPRPTPARMPSRAVAAAATAVAMPPSPPAG